VARLQLESGGERRELKVTGTLTVGRSQTAGVYLDDKTLSREHTQFYVQSGRLFVKDLESKNGTYLNGSLVKGDQPLKHGDKVKVGTATFTVVLEAGDAMPAVSAPLAAPPSHKPPTHHPAPRLGTPTQTAPAAAARTRPTLGGPHWFSVFIYRIILIVVIVIVAYVSKGFFARLLSGINS
jgi:pSer/pThr/pTyr-binding forkhead associated (FHA) protein